MTGGPTGGSGYMGGTAYGGGGGYRKGGGGLMQAGQMFEQERAQGVVRKAPEDLAPEVRDLVYNMLAVYYADTLQELNK